MSNQTSNGHDDVRSIGDLAKPPLVTFALLAYNQEKFVRAAVEGALAQDYQTLEIIFSDDCSSDGTFHVMQRVAEAYRGPHKVILNQNSENLNIGDHINKVAQLATGELVVLAAGDDISLPSRTTRLVARWLSLGRAPSVIYSDFQAIDASSVFVELQHEKVYRGSHDLLNMTRGNIHILGATTAISRDVFTSFQPLDRSVRHEDRVLPFRAMLLGGEVSLVDEKLVWYRMEGGVSRTSIDSAAAFLFGYVPDISARTLPDAIQRLLDLKTMMPERRDLERECISTITDQHAHIALSRVSGALLEVSLIKTLLKGARLKIFRYYLKRRLFLFFNIYFRRSRRC